MGLQTHETPDHLHCALQLAESLNTLSSLSDQRESKDLRLLFSMRITMTAANPRTRAWVRVGEPT
jgi:hypothetical protein